jgi:hypothetical protein
MFGIHDLNSRQIENALKLLQGAEKIIGQTCNAKRYLNQMPQR